MKNTMSENNTCNDDKNNSTDGGTNSSNHNGNQKHWLESQQHE